jgi:hypothetical protein
VTRTGVSKYDGTIDGQRGDSLPTPRYSIPFGTFALYHGGNAVSTKYSQQM